jgi:hypothetical protein
MKGLTPEQHHAVDLLVQGKTDQEAAHAVSVAGDSVTHWRREAPSFIAALNRDL